MGGSITQRREGWRGLWLALAVLALMMKIAAPPGFMVAETSPGGGLALVICTGHGPLTAGAPEQKGGERKGHADAPCAFAGHAAPPTPSLGAPVHAPAFAGYAPSILMVADLSPGRGLAAPPPPAQGPPILL